MRVFTLARTKTDVCLIDVEVALERTNKRHVWRSRKGGLKSLHLKKVEYDEGVFAVMKKQVVRSEFTSCFGGRNPCGLGEGTRG